MYRANLTVRALERDASTAEFKTIFTYYEKIKVKEKFSIYIA